MCVHIHISISLSLYIYIYIYILPMGLSGLSGLSGFEFSFVFTSRGVSVLFVCFDGFMISHILGFSVVFVSDANDTRFISQVNNPVNNNSGALTRGQT